MTNVAFPLVEVRYTVEYDDNDKPYTGYCWTLRTRFEDGYVPVLHSSLSHLFETAEAAYAAGVSVALVCETLRAANTHGLVSESR